MSLNLGHVPAYRYDGTAGRIEGYTSQVQDIHAYIHTLISSEIVSIDGGQPNE